MLICFVEANLVNADYHYEVRERQQRRLEAGDRSDFKFRVVMIAVTNINV